MKQIKNSQIIFHDIKFTRIFYAESVENHYKEKIMSILVAGASTGIGNALVAALRARSDEPLYTISRSDLGQHNLQIDLSDASNISAVQTFLASIQPTRVFAVQVCCTMTPICQKNAQPDSG